MVQHAQSLGFPELPGINKLVQYLRQSLHPESWSTNTWFRLFVNKWRTMGAVMLLQCMQAAFSIFALVFHHDIPLIPCWRNRASGVVRTGRILFKTKQKNAMVHNFDMSHIVHRMTVLYQGQIISQRNAQQISSDSGFHAISKGQRKEQTSSNRFAQPRD